MQKMKFRGYQLFHDNRDATASMVRQTDDFPSFFTPVGDFPLIIDCGANIGVSVLEWKSRWPQSRVICFEPDPFAFALLRKNIDGNDIPGVECVNAAVSDCDGRATLYGDISRSADARGNSIDAAWGKRTGSEQTSVACTRLSPYLADREISFLKLDIEGAEERVLKEAAAYLGNVQAIYVEVHETDDSLSYNSQRRIRQLLAEAGFQIEAESRYDEHSLPAHLDSWRRSVNARQAQLIGWRELLVDFQVERLRRAKRSVAMFRRVGAKKMGIWRSERLSWPELWIAGLL